MKSKLIIFDCDGVLVDSESISNGVIAEMLTDLGWPTSVEEAYDLFAGTTLKLIQEKLMDKTGKPAPPDFEQTFRSRCFERFNNELKPIEGIHNALDQIPLEKCVASNGPLHKIESNLGLAKLTDYFGENLFSAYQIKKWKPEPDLYLYAAKRMGYEVKDCIVVEDSTHGVKAGIDAGMSVFGYAGHSNPTLLKEEGAIVFDDMNALPNLIKEKFM